MAAGSMKDIKLRIKSVESTMQITKAMELVASSKLRRARERVEKARPYFTALYKTLGDIAAKHSDFSSDFLTRRPVKKAAYIIIAGDRGLAGGYNNNIFKLFMADKRDADICVLPVGKKATEYIKRRGFEIISERYSLVENIDMTACEEIGDIVTSMYKAGEVDRVYVCYTDFVSMLSQKPRIIQMLPIKGISEESRKGSDSLGTVTMYEPEGEVLFDMIVPRYATGLTWGAVTESWASELAARRTAMDSASKNAEEMVANLSLEYNRARQAAITQEITEIVGGAGEA